MEENKNKTPERKLKPVAKANIKKKSEFEKIASTFLTEDIDTVKNYVVKDVIVPTIKKTIVEIITNGINILLYGDSGSQSKTTVASKISYNSCYNSNVRKDTDRLYSGFDYDKIEYKTRGDAQMVLYAMEESIEKYGFVTVGDYYDLSEVTTDNYAVCKYGWTDINSANIYYSNGGYFIKLPRCVPIK